jgi:hypothetical protein
LACRAWKREPAPFDYPFDYEDCPQVTTSIIGRRFERLLFLAAPISFVSLILLFVAIATTTQTERVTARCYQAGAASLEAKRSELDSEWSKAGKPTKDSYWGSQYKFELATTIIHGHLGSPCYDILRKRIDERYRTSPEELISALRTEANSIFQSPLQFWGVELPDRAAIDVLGTKVKIELMTFVRLLQVALAPIIVLWLGSLYNTRYRESLLIGSAKLVTDIFPHVINMYPAVQYPEARKRTYVQHHLPKVFAFLYAAMRVFLVTIFVAPSVLAYVLSLFLLDSDDLRMLFIAIGVIVFSFSFFVAIAEFLPWHYWKVFPGPSWNSDKQQR